MGMERKGRSGAAYFGCFITFLLILFPFHGVLSADVDEDSLYEDCKRAYMDGRMDEANEKVKRFLAAFPESQHRWESKFIQARSEPLIDAAIQGYESLVSEKPASEWTEKACVELIKCYYLLSEYDKALTYCESISPSLRNDDICYWASRCLLSKGENKAGMSILRNLNGIAGHKMALGVADSYFGKQEYDHAAELYEWVIKNSKEKTLAASAYVQLCKILRQMGKNEEAQERYQNIIVEYPQTSEAQLVRFYLQELQESALYIVQIGAFSKEANAEALLNQLKTEKYEAYLTVSEGNDDVFRVKIGPFKSKDDAEKAASKLRKDHNLPAVVLRRSTD